jgi:hypothetical protein
VNWLAREAEPVPETTLPGVTLFTRSRAKKNDVFDITISPRGIEIHRPEQEVRLLEWDRVATWEIEQRNRSALLVLRGGGSVTPLLIPGWRVDDLDQLLREMTAHLAPPVAPPDEAPDLDLEAVATADVDYSDLDLPDVLSLGSASESGGTPPLREMDLSLPSPSLVTEPADSEVDMDLSLPPLAAPESTSSAIEMEEEGEDELN